jgi:hypothetical protein
LASSPGARLRLLIIETCHADDRMRRLETAIANLPGERRPIVLASFAADGRARENSVNGYFTAALLRQLRRPRRAGAKTLDLLDIFNGAADEVVGRIGREPLFSANGVGRLRVPLLTQSPLPFASA